MNIEILMPKMPRGGTRILQAMIDAKPEGVRLIKTETWQRAGKTLMLYGYGHPCRQAWAQQHMANGGKVIAWDLGYWNRDEGYMRVAVNGQHPRNMPRQTSKRWEKQGIELRKDFDPNGPIVLVGLGPKTRIQFGMHGQEWENRTLARIRAAYPGRRIVYRPKRDESLYGLQSIGGPIEDVLRGASLVVCRHSNVAIDACIAGVPVVCEDGAAVALYGNDIANTVEPQDNERLQFLCDLAHWQWKPTEAAEAWKFLLRST